MKLPHNTGPHLISAAGFGVMGLALYLHWRYGYDLELMVLLLGGFVVWYGGYLANRKAALEGGNFIVESLVKLGGVFRFTSAKPGGMRTEDQSPVPTVVIPAPTPTPVVPDADAVKP